MNADVQTSGLIAIVLGFFFFFFSIAKVTPWSRLRGGEENYDMREKEQRELRGRIGKKNKMRYQASIRR